MHDRIQIRIQILRALCLGQMDETKKQRKVSCYSKCVALINTPPCSKALSAEQRSTCCSTFIDDVSTLCVCLIVFFFVPPENFSLMETLQIFPSARHSWSLGSEGSFACHTYCDTGHLQGPVTLTPTAERLAVELSLPVLTT